MPEPTQTPLSQLSSMPAEFSILCAILCDPQAYDVVSASLPPEAFYSSSNRRIYEAMGRLSMAGNPIDIVSIGNDLNAQNLLEDVGGYTYLTTLKEQSYTSQSLSHHVEIVFEFHVLRAVYITSVRLQQEAISPGANPHHVLEAAETSLFKLSSSRRIGVTKIGDYLPQAFEVIERHHSTPGGMIGVPSGLTKLDEITCGFNATDLIILAGRPSMGKTALALTSARNTAQLNHAVGFFSLEMSAQQLALRLISMSARVSSQLIKLGKVDREGFQRIATTINSLQTLPLYIDDTPQLTIQELRSRARILVSRYNVEIIYVDYLQLLRIAYDRFRQFENRVVEVSLISQMLKALAKELNIPVVALSQLSRAVETRGGDRRPVLSDLRESGAIEQDADVVMFVYRPEVYDRVEIEGQAEVIIAKQRNGPLGTANLKYVKEFTLFENLSSLASPAGYDDEILKSVPF